MRTINLILAFIVACTSGAAMAQTITYYHTDQQGTPIAVTDVSRNVIERNEYSPYGDRLNRPDTDGPGFTGHVLDAATGFIYMQQRYYDPMLGVFLSVDPVTAYKNPVVYFHRYRYAANNPYTFIDPDGRIVTLSGDQEGRNRFIALASKFTGLDVKRNRDGTLSATGKVTNGAGQALMAAIRSEHTIGLRAVSNDPGVFVDQFQTGKVDVADIGSISAKSLQMGQAMFTHMLTEQRVGMELGGRVLENYSAAHKAALAAESAVMGAVYRTDNMSSMFRQMLSLDIKFQYRDRGWNVVRSFSFEQDENGTPR